MATTWRRGLAGLLSVFAFLVGTGLRAHAATTLIPTTPAPFVVVQIDSGSVNIRTWDRPAIDLEADPTITYNHAPPRQVASRIPQQIPLWSQTLKTPQGQELDLAPELFPLPPFAPGEHDAVIIRGQGDVTLTVPAQSPLLLINVRVGSVTLSGYSGTAFVAHVVAGEVHMDNVSTTAAVQVNNGPVFISNSTFERLRLRTGRGTIFMSACRARQIQVTSLTGSIIFDNGVFEPGLAHFESDRGNVVIGAASGMQIEAHSGRGRILYDIGSDGSVNRSAQDAQATLMGGGPVVTASSVNGAVIFFRGTLHDYPQFERLLTPKTRTGFPGQPPQMPQRQPLRRVKPRAIQMKTTWEPHEKHGTLTMQSDLPDSVYAFPKQRKEPLTDASHVRNAVARFDQVIDVSDEDRALAFANIQKAAQYYGVNLTETPWKDLGSHPQANRKESAAKAVETKRRYGIFEEESEKAAETHRRERA